MSFFRDWRMVGSMFEAKGNEFAFMADLPAREKTKAQQALHDVREFLRLQKEHGLVPLFMVPAFLRLSQQRVSQFVSEGRLGTVNIGRHIFVKENDLVEFAKAERKTGRPFKAPSLKECAEQGIQHAKTLLK